MVTASTPVVAASAIAGGKALSVMCQTTSALISTVEDTAFALWVPVSATLVIKEIIVKKVRIISSSKREEKVHYPIGSSLLTCCESLDTALHNFLSLRFFSLTKT